MARVSAIVPVYNGAATVGRAIESVLAQGFDGLEVIVVDDGSTDSTPEVLSDWQPTVKVVRRDNRGPAAARNAGAKVATGEYLAFLDADDLWMPGKLARLVAALEAAPGAVLAYSDVAPVDDDLRQAGASPIGADYAHAPSMNEMLTRWWPILTSTVVMRRETFERCGGFCEEFRVPGFEDPYLWILTRERGEFVYVPEPLVSYRVAPAAKYTPGAALFIRLVRNRYGAAARPLIREVRRGQVAALGYQGLVAMRRGESAEARRAFIRALRLAPLNLRTAMRLVRTFLPPAMSRSLAGRTRDQSVG